MLERVETVIIGAGQAGLALSWHLAQLGREHLLLEQADALASVWRNERWDSFTLVTPNHTLRLPGFPYRGHEPGGYLERDGVVRYLESYAASFHPPVRLSTKVTALDPGADGDRFRVRTATGDLAAAHVVVATGTLHVPTLPPFAGRLDSGVRQVHSREYRNPAALPPGAVLVVGSGQSGTQITDDLLRAGRTVWLSTGGAKRLHRRYRGRDMVDWLEQIGFFAQTFAEAPEPKRRFEANPQLSGYGGGREINLHQFARDGVRLLGRLVDGEGTRLRLAPDVHQHLRAADQFAAEINRRLDAYIERTGIDAPPEPAEPPLSDGFALPERTELDLRAEAIGAIIWAGGYRMDWSWLHLPVIDETGYPIQERGITAVPGLAFLGLHWMHTRASMLFMGVGADAAFLAERMFA